MVACGLTNSRPTTRFLNVGMTSAGGRGRRLTMPKLLTTIYAILKSGRPYDPAYRSAARALPATA